MAPRELKSTSHPYFTDSEEFPSSPLLPAGVSVFMKSHPQLQSLPCSVCASSFLNYSLDAKPADSAPEKAPEKVKEETSKATLGQCLDMGSKDNKDEARKPLSHSISLKIQNLQILIKHLAEFEEEGGPTTAFLKTTELIVKVAGEIGNELTGI